jgi:peptidoglycan/xylan/chitin deacetylase (PgdA/CDA1 family)
MNVLHILSKSRSPRNTAARILTVIRHFGLTPKKFENRLKKYYEVMHSEGCLPTLAITAVVLDRHPKYIQELSRQGVEFAIHGYVHIDYKIVDNNVKRKHFRKAIDIFDRNRIPFIGFRAPFLRTNENTTPILSELGFVYHSSRVFSWPVIDTDEFSGYVRNNYKRLMEFCSPFDSQKYFSLPKFEDGLIEIPVSLPDDETIIERLNIADEKKIGGIWLEILQNVYNNGELFILSLHPERIEICETALRDTLRKAKALSPTTWVATLKEIAEWWKEKTGFSLKVTALEEGRYKVRAICSDRATIIVKSAKVNVPARQWFDGYQTIDERDFILESPKYPVIGVSPGTSRDAIQFLMNEGYPVEESNEADKYGIYLSDLAKFEEEDEKTLSRKIEESGVPLLRYWRWPNKTRCSLSVTGDIDSITIFDFVFRILENGLKNL